MNVKDCFIFNYTNHRFPLALMGNLEDIIEKTVIYYVDNENLYIFYNNTAPREKQIEAFKDVLSNFEDKTNIDETVISIVNAQPYSFVLICNGEFQEAANNGKTEK